MAEPLDAYDLREHQTKALNKLSNGKILWGGVGTGKSRVAACYYHKYEAPKRVYVITTAKKRDSFDWQEEFYRIGIGPATGPFLDPARKGKGRRRRAGSDDQLVGRSGGQSGNGSQVQGDGSSSGEGNRGEAVREVSASSANGPDSSVGKGSTLRRGAVLRGDGTGGSGSSGDLDQVGRGVDVIDPSVSEFRGSQRGADVAGFGEAASYPWVLTVDSWNNIAKYADVAGAFFIFDEQRLVGSGDWTRKFLRIAKHNNWILLSGTPGDTWMDYIPVFVANNFYKNRTHFKREHVVYNTFTKFPKVDRYIGVNKLHHLRARLLVEMPYERHTRRRVVEVPLKYDKEALEMVLKKRWHIYENRPLRDIAEMFSVGRRLVNSDPSRLEMVKELWGNHPKLIVFYNFNYELEILRSLGQTQLPVSTTSSSLGSEKASLVSRSSASAAVQTSAIPRRETERTTSTTSTTTSGSIPPRVDRDDPRWRWSTYGNSTDYSGKSLPGTSSLNGRGLGSTSSTLESDPTVARKSTRSNSTTSSGMLESKCPDGGSTSSKTKPSDLSCQIAEWNGHKHEAVPSTDRWLYLVQYTAGAEGWNCIETDAMIMFSRNYSWKVYEQAQGRIDRLNSPFSDLWYYDFTTDSFIDRAIGRSLKAKQTFNEAKYARLFKG